MAANPPLEDGGLLLMAFFWAEGDGPLPTETEASASAEDKFNIMEDEVPMRLETFSDVAPDPALATAREDFKAWVLSLATF